MIEEDMRDNEFIRGKVPMTKMPIRASIISYLQLYSASRLLDLGAGTGSVSIQAKKMFPSLEVTSLERNSEGIGLIRQNADKHDVNLQIVEGEVPYVILDPLIHFDRLYIGGSGGDVSRVIEWVMPYLASQARIVASFITIELFYDFMNIISNDQRFEQVEALHLAASTMESLGRYHYFKPQNPCHIVACYYRGK